MTADGRPHDMSSNGSDTDPDGLPADLRHLAQDEGAREDYAALWRLLHRADDAAETSFPVDAAWNELAEGLDLPPASPGAANEPHAPNAPHTAKKPDTAKKPARPRASRTPDRTARLSARRKTRPSWVRQTALAGAVLLCVALGAVAWWRQPVTVQTAAGEQTTVTLPDGSTAELHGATTLAYTRGFASLPGLDASRRQVRLRGEAFFSVDPAARPFRVETPNASVEVLGTTFTVRARPQHTATPTQSAPASQSAPATQIVLHSGRVRFSALPASPRDSVPTVVLGRAGQQSRVTGFKTVPTSPAPIDLKYVAAWRYGGFAVRNADLPAILRELEIQFGTTIRLGVPPSQTETMTLHYHRDVQLADILRDIAIIQGLRFQQMSDGYALVP